MRSIALLALAASALFVAPAAMAQQQGAGQSQGMTMNQFMARCVQIRAQVRPGALQSPQLRQTLDQCDQMDRSMGMEPPPRR